MIRPILEYGCIIYDNCTSGEAELLESVQLDAARVCTGALWNTSKYKLLEELGWATLSTRRKFFKLCTLFKMHHDLLSKEFSNIDNLHKFKKTLSATLFPASVPLHFNSGHRFASIYHAQLRLGHSHLCSHTFI